MTDLNSQSQMHKKEVCIIMAGSVDSGKSSFIGVISTGKLDDGNGSARGAVAKHPHEIKTGKTSDISTKVLQFKDENDKIISEVQMVDLCGHEKYLKTTVYGMLGLYPDYGIVVISANRGILPMTLEHLRVLVCMKIPFSIIITRVDLVSDNNAIYNKTINQLKRQLKQYKNLIFINSLEEYTLSNEELVQKEILACDEVEKYAGLMKDNPNLVLVITLSNKTGYYINVAKHLVSSLKPLDNSQVWNQTLGSNSNGSIFYIDGKFNPPGVGLVVSGLVRGNGFQVGSEVLIGPYGKQFLQARVWSMHDNNKTKIKELGNKQRGCLALRMSDKKIDFTRDNIRKGMIIISKDVEQNICFEFSASIKVFKHSTTITNRYSPVIHCGVVRQTARIILDENKHLKMGDKADVKFRFVSHPEFIEKGMKFFFRESTTRGVGTITDILPISKDSNPNPAEAKKVRFFRKKNYRRGNKKNKKKINIL